MTLRSRIALALYRLGWLLGMPLARAYLRRRARRDPAYGLHLEERTGRGPTLADAVVVHAVSLGEMRSAVPLVRALLDRGERVVTTHLTPAGRTAAETAFADEIAQGRLIARYLPVETATAWRRFLGATRPRAVLVLEVEIWPVMIAEAARAGVPLWLVNSQVPGRSFNRARALARLIGHPVAQVAGVLAKSDRHAERFRLLGARNVHVGGELRFDQPIPPSQIEAATSLRPFLGRPVVTFASVVAGEEETCLAAIRELQASARTAGRPAPLAVWVPRAPERFARTCDWLAAQGFTVVRRSTALDVDLASANPSAIAAADVLFGDSMGEMYFYLALADAAVVGGGFTSKGAHNVIEPLALRKPVFTGPEIWTIEYPGKEARDAGVLTLCTDAHDLATRIDLLLSKPQARDGAARAAAAFFATHGGATARSMAVLGAVLDAQAARR